MEDDEFALTYYTDESLAQVSRKRGRPPRKKPLNVSFNNNFLVTPRKNGEKINKTAPLLLNNDDDCLIVDELDRRSNLDKNENFSQNSFVSDCLDNGSRSNSPEFA